MLNDSQKNENPDSGGPNPETKGKRKFLEHILRPIEKPISSLPDHSGIGVKMTSTNIELPQILGLGFSVRVGQL